MNTFYGAFKVALEDAGYTPKKVNDILTVWKAKDRYLGGTPEAVVAVVRGDRGKEA